IPVLVSEVTWEVPNEVQSRIWTVPTFGVQVAMEKKARAGYTEAKFSAQNLPSTPREIYGYPFRDQATRMMVVPMAYRDADNNIPILESWAAVCEGLDKDYVRARRESAQVAAKAASLTQGKSTEDFPVILYRFVRDEIKNTSGEG